MAELKNTRQREAILKLFHKNEEPLSAEEIYAALKNDFSSIALSTVYRNLERFTEAGLLTKDSFNDGVIRYSTVSEHGHYLVCTGCDCKIRLDDCPLSGLETELAKNTGFEIDSHSLTVYGKCPRCRHVKKD